MTTYKIIIVSLLLFLVASVSSGYIHDRNAFDNKHDLEEEAHYYSSSRQRPSSKQDEHDGDDNAANRLLHAILEDYSKEVMPERPITVKLDLLLMKVKSTIEKDGIFETVVALFLHWPDKRMSWSPEKYGNITTLTFNPNKLWMPDIAMINSADNPYGITKDYRFLARLSHDGVVKFVPTGTARTWCTLRLITFPFDIQTCSFEFESWSMDSTVFNFNKTSTALVDETFVSPQWSLCHRDAFIYDYTYSFADATDTFSRVRYEFVVRRKSTFYIVNLIFPCATLSLTQLLVFTIPSKKTLSDRVGFGTVNVLTLVVFQTIISRQLPRSSDAISALSHYIIALIIISSLGILQSVIVEGLQRKNNPPSKWLVNLLKHVPMLWEAPTTERRNDNNDNKKSVVFHHQKMKADKKHQEATLIMMTPLLPADIAKNVRRRINVCKGSIRPALSISDEIINNNNNKKKPKKSSSLLTRSRRWRELNVRQWEELITRFDCFVFLLATAAAVLVPVFLFLPIIVVDDVLCPLSSSS